MQQLWSSEGLRKHWVLTAKEHLLLKGLSGRRKLVLAYYLKYFLQYAQFPSLRISVPEAVADFLGEQVGFLVPLPSQIPKRTDRYYRKMVSEHLRLKRFDKSRTQSFSDWLVVDVLVGAPPGSDLDSQIVGWFLSHRVIRPKAARVDKIVASAERKFERHIFKVISSRLTVGQKSKLDVLVSTADTASPFSGLGRSPSGASVQAVQDVVARLDLVRGLGISGDVLADIHEDHVAQFARRASGETAWDMRRHPPAVRYGLLCSFCVLKLTDLIDDLGDLIIGITHKISARAESKVIKEYVADFRKVESKDTLLGKIVVAVDRAPEGHIPDVIFPVVGRDMIHELAQSYMTQTPSFTYRVQKSMRQSYGRHYRRILPIVLGALAFKSNSPTMSPLLKAIVVLNAEPSSKAHYYSVEDVPIEDIVPRNLHDLMIEAAPDGLGRINRIGYEICVLQRLREKLRTKEIWLEGAKRYCDPDQDLPTDFDVKRSAYFDLLGQPEDPVQFVGDLKQDLSSALVMFDRDLPFNKEVSIKHRSGKARISLKQLGPQSDPKALDALKDELARRWPMTSLLDVLKEVDLRTDFTSLFQTASARQSLSPQDVSRRLLLTLFGLGTNIGLKAISAGPHGVSYKELLYMRQRFIHKTALQDTTRRIADATYRIRNAEIWGSGSTSCASDSTQLASWDQNLMTEWHQRYGGRGVMIYWHVDAKATCVHSQLKQVSSSEVASMIEGVLHHGTDLEVERQFVDTHGQSVVGFAFCYLLGFDLMPRLKGIAGQRLSRAEKISDVSYDHIDPICMARPIDWALIARHYDEMIKLAIALKTRTADAEAILRRFRRGQAHPLFSALVELGKAVKTLFLCRYLSDANLRREINSGLNVIERWNGVNNFIFYGKGGELVSNRQEDHTISVLALHLVQACMVYINTVMLQNVLAEPAWRQRMTPCDMAALNPLPHAHFNPYGVFPLDMDDRLPLEQEALAA